MSDPDKTHEIRLRCAPGQKGRFNLAARAAGTTLEKFILASAEAAVPDHVHQQQEQLRRREKDDTPRP